MRKRILYPILVLLAAIAAFGIAYLNFGKERLIHLIFKYGLKIAVAAIAIIIVLIIIVVLVEYYKKKREKQREAEKINLKDFFSDLN